MLVNGAKTKVVHLRKPIQLQSKFQFTIDNGLLEYTNHYKYLCLNITCHFNFTEAMELLSHAPSRALGMLVSKYKIMKYMGFSTYDTLYKAAVAPVMDYASEMLNLSKMRLFKIVPT